MEPPVSGQSHVKERPVEAGDDSRRPGAVSAKEVADQDHGRRDFWSFRVTAIVSVRRRHMRNDITGNKFVFTLNVGAVEGSMFAISLVLNQGNVA